MQNSYRVENRTASSELFGVKLKYFCYLLLFKISLS